MSIILCPKILQINNYNLITPMAAIAVCQAIESTTDKAPKIKWVNDIFLNERKICGILTETTTDTASITNIVIGIGVNFTQPESGFPQEIEQSAGALFDSNPPITRNQLIAEIINNVLAHEHTAHGIITAYKTRLLMLGRRVSVIAPNLTYEATAVDLNDDCCLLVQNDSGEIIALNAGEISLR